MLIVLVILLSLVAGAALWLLVMIYSKNQKLREENKELKSEVEHARNTFVEQERFLAYTSHEIRTPLNAISGGTQLLTKTNLDSRQQKYLNAIQSGVDSALLIVNDILDLSKIDSNMVEVRPVDFMITEVINGVKNILHYRAEQKGIEFITTIDPKIPPIIRGDAKHLNQILLNLSTNAVKFTDIGKVEVCIDVIDENETDIKLRCRVIDSGKGIRKSSLPTIFNQYEQETRHTIKHAGGTGLGLAITKKLVELQGGTIQVESQYLQGTTFTVELTYKKVFGAQVVTTLVNDEVRRQLEGIKILLVDDNMINREILHDLIMEVHKGIEIVMAENGEIAVNKLYHGGFDIVLLDIQMPKMNGYETAEFIRKNMKYPLSEIPIIAMTAHALENVAESCFKAGMNDYIAKPIEIDFLVSKMVKLLEKKKVVQEKYNKYHVIDLNHLKELTKENEERMQKYIGIFLQNVPHDIEMLKRNFNEKNYEGFKDTAHKIKGNVAYMGIKNLAELFNSAEYGKLEELKQEEFEKIYNDIASTCLAAIDELKEVKKVL